MPQNESIHDSSYTQPQPRHREQARDTLNTRRDFNERTNNGRPPHSRFSTSITFGGNLNVIAASPPGTSTPRSSENDQNETHLADSDSHADMELILSNVEKIIRKMETKICTLSNLNRQEREGRVVLQESCRRLEDAVRAREYEVANLKRQLDESEQERRRVVQEFGTRNSRHGTEDNRVQSLGHVADERPGTNHDVVRTSRHEHRGNGRGRRVEWPPINPPQVPRPIGENIDPGPDVRRTGPYFVGGFWPSLS